MKERHGPDRIVNGVGEVEDRERRGGEVEMSSEGGEGSIWARVVVEDGGFLHSVHGLAVAERGEEGGGISKQETRGCDHGNQ